MTATVTEILSPAQEAINQAKEAYVGNLYKDYKINDALELQYYHVLLINPRTDEFGVPLEQPRLVKLMPAEYNEQAKASFYGYNVKVLHDPTQQA